MPGKTSQLGGRKQDFSAKDKCNERSSVRKVSIWPEWSEAAILAEKWELGVGGGGKGKDKKGQLAVSHYEDPDKVLLPSSLVDPSIVIWKRPNDPLISDVLDKLTPVIVSDPELTSLDLHVSNTHLFHNQFMCWIIGQLNALWKIRYNHLALDFEGTVTGEKESLPWCPWEHIQPHLKGMPSPQINPAGKYYIRIYWMGCWRKVTVDDKLPFLEKSFISCNSDQDDQVQENKNGVNREHEKGETSFIPLFPMTSNLAELWPALIFKAILKVAALDYSGGDTNNDYGDSSVIHMLTGWTHHTVKLNFDHTWDLLTDHLPMWICDWDTHKKHKPPKKVKKHATRKDCILLACFNSCYTCHETRPFPTTHRQIRKSETLLKRFSIIPQVYSLFTQPSMPVLMTQVRDQLLVPSPPEPPLPILQAPYYLGLTHRQPHPGYPTPLPTAPIAEPRFVELFPSILVHEAHSLSTYCSKSANINSNIATSTAKSLLAKPNKMAISMKNTLITSTSSGSSEQSKTCKENGKKWMNYLEFCSAFNAIHIFKDPYNFKYKDTYFDLSKTLESVPVITGSSRKGITTPHVVKVLVQPPTEHNFLLVDSVDPVELLFVFSSLSNWREGDKDTNLCTPSKQVSACSPTTSPEGTQPPVSEQKITIDHISDGAKSDSSLVENELQKMKKHILPGRLVVQTYCWRTVQFGDPVLQISTTGTKGAELPLPPGRHVFKLHIEAPIGHHLEIFSQAPFTLTDEDTMFGCLSQDCFRFVSYSRRIIDHLLASSAHCGDFEALNESLQPLAKLCSEASLISNHAKFLLAGALHSWSRVCHELTGKMQQAWKAFLQEVFHILEKLLSQGSPPAMGEVSELRQRLKMYFNGKLKPAEVSEAWLDRKPTAKEIHAAKVISHFIQQRSKANLKSSMVPGSEANEIAAKLLKESLPILELEKEKLGAMLLHGIIKLDPCIADKLPFAEDLNNTAYSALYTGVFPSIQTNSWTIILRKTLHISEVQFVAFHFKCSLQTSLLRVINNDTMAEMPRVFQNTTPCIYIPNCKGYTLQAEAWVPGITAPATEEDEKKWKLLLVTSNKERPPVMTEWNTEEGKEIEEVFNRQEIIDYCLPNREDILFRYSMSPSEQCKVSIQATVSKHDALLKLEILDYEDVVAAVEGRGTCTIPLCSLQHSPLPGTLVKEVSQGEKINSHKYLVQGSILIKSWPTADTAWPQLSSIKSTDRTEESTPWVIKPGSGKRKKIKMSSTSTAIMTIDTRKPHWVLQIVSKNSEGHLTVKKDTEKDDKLKSMVEAWEMQEPGRTQKAQLSRQKFLEAHIIHEEGKDQEDIRSVIGVLAQKLKPNTGPIKIRQMDLSPFILKAEEDQPPKLLDEAERAHRLEERRKMFKEYRVTRKAMLQVRNRDRELRNVAKLKQLETAEKWQMELDFRRLKLNYIQESPLQNHQAMEKANTEKEAELTVANVASEVQSPLGGRESKVKGVKKKK